MKKVMHNTDKLYIRSVIHHKYTADMHNLKTNFDKLFNITKSVFKDRLNQSDNYYFYPNKPKLSDCEIIALSVTGESLGIDSESYFLGIILLIGFILQITYLFKNHLKVAFKNMKKIVIRL